MLKNETKMGISGIIYPLLRNLFYDEERDQIRNIEKLNFVAYLPDPKLSTDEELKYTQVVDEFSLPVSNCSIDLEELANRIINLKETEALGISSLVETEKGIRHIGMIDFLTHNGSLCKCIKTIEEIEEKGFIINSSNSYNTHHFYSTKDLLTEQQFTGFMEKLKNLESIGPNWPNLQLKQNYALLRISGCKYKESIPYIVTHVR